MGTTASRMAVVVAVVLLAGEGDTLDPVWTPVVVREVVGTAGGHNFDRVVGGILGPVDK